MKTIYLDNASTSFPKAPGVAEAVAHFLSEIGCNVNRGSYQGALAAEEVVFDTRERLCALAGGRDSRNVVFTSNITHSLNLLVKGLLRPGDHVLVSVVEHNALMRPLVQLEPQGVTFSRIPCDKAGQMDLAAVESLIRPNTKAVFMTHASNVCGTILPARQVGEIAKKHGLAFVLDSAQTLGAFPVDMEAMGIDALAFTGHKSLLGPQGIGGIVFRPEMAARVSPLIAGGTGSRSDSEEQPEFLPDKFEAGTPNLPGIYGLHAALRYLEETGIGEIRDRELALAKKLHDGLAEIPGIRMVGTDDWTRRAPIVSVDFPERDNARIAYQLSEGHGVMTRCGLHCAPNAHKTLGTFPQGTIRFSVSHRNTGEEMEQAVAAVRLAVAEG